MCEILSKCREFGQQLKFENERFEGWVLFEPGHAPSANAQASPKSLVSALFTKADNDGQGPIPGSQLHEILFERFVQDRLKKLGYLE